MLRSSGKMTDIGGRRMSLTSDVVTVVNADARLCVCVCVSECLHFKDESYVRREREGGRDLHQTESNVEHIS